MPSAVYTAKRWEEVAAAKVEEVVASIPAEWLIPTSVLPSKTTKNVSTFVAQSGMFSAREIELTAASASTIVAKVAAREWTAEEVTRAFCKSAAVAHQLVNCLTATLFPEAIAAAKALDETFSRTGKVVGPLHGVPISLKDNVNIKGLPSSVGLICWANEKQEKNTLIVDVLTELGAVVYVKTNVPTAMMMAETVNNVFGRTVNPLNRDLTPGGSSGGESALIAAYGSPLGVGTDIGGSLRIPASTTGLFTIRSSYGRLPNFDFRAGIAGQEAILSVQGPIARTLEDVILYSKAIIDTKPWFRDPKLHPIPWRTVDLPQRLKFAVMWNDGFVNLTPPVKRALEVTVAKLIGAGHEVVDWDTTGVDKLYSVIRRLFCADGGKTIRHLIEAGDEPLPKFLSIFANSKEIGTYDMWQVIRERDVVMKETMDKWNSISGLDGIIMASAPYISTPHDKFTHAGYTGIWNLLDYPAAVFPCGVVADETIDLKPDSTAPGLNKLDEETRDAYDPHAVNGMSVGLQIIGRRLQEEKVLAMVSAVLEAVE